MEKILIEGDVLLGNFDFDFEKGKFRISGRLIDRENNLLLFKIIDSVKLYFLNPLAQTELNLEIDYMNSGCKKHISNLLFVFFENKQKSELIINWYYNEDDEDSYNFGLDIADLLGIKINFIEMN